MCSIFDQKNFMDLCEGIAEKVNLSEVTPDSAELCLSYVEDRCPEVHDEIVKRLQRFYDERKVSFFEPMAEDSDFGIALATIFMINGIDLDAEFKLLVLNCISEDMENLERFKNKWERIRIMRSLTREIHSYKKDGHDFDWRSLVEVFPETSEPEVSFVTDEDIVNMHSSPRDLSSKVKIGVQMSIPDYLESHSEVINYVYDKLSSLRTDDDTLKIGVSVKN